MGFFLYFPMDTSSLFSFFAKFWNVDPKIISREMTLDDRNLPQNSSIRFYLFMAAIEKEFKVTLDEVHTIMTFGDLCDRIRTSGGLN